MTEEATFKVTVHAPKDRYRRAGLGFNKGENVVTATQKQIAVMNTDPRLKVLEVVDALKTSGNADHAAPETSGADAVELDLSAVAPEVATWVAAIHDHAKAGWLKLTSNGVPDVKALEESVELEDGSEVKLTAAIRDEAWAVYQELTGADA